MNKRTLGSYYTPIHIADAIVESAISLANEKILDPSFGGCVFLESAFRRLGRLGNPNPSDNIYGCDIDPSSFEYLLSSTIKFKKNNFFDNDYLDQEFSEKFDIIIGNPPYIKHDHIPKQAKFRAKRLIESSGIPSAIKPNYWYYFVIKSINLLAENGSIFFILPQSFYTAKYSRVLIKHLSEEFQNIDILPIKGHVFEGTNEVVCIVALRGFKCREASSEPRYHKEVDAKDISNSLRQIVREKRFEIEDSIGFLTSIKKQYNLPSISDLASVKIGTVTGYKSFFVMSRKKATDLGIPHEFLKPVVSDAHDLDRMRDGTPIHSLPLMLCIPPSYSMDGLYAQDKLNDYLRNAPDQARHSYHALNRNPWYSLRLTHAPQGFIKNLSRGKYHIYSNHGNLLCTNNILGIHDPKVDIEILECASVSKLFNASAGVLAMNYGRMAKKLDPRHVKSIIVPLNEEIIISLRELIKKTKGRYSEFEVDKVIYRHLDISEESISRIEAIIMALNG